MTLNGYIVHYNGIYFHDWHDLTIFKQGLSVILDLNEKIFADKAYVHSKCLIPHKEKKISH